jgi:hypothetical protein
MLTSEQAIHKLADRMRCSDGSAVQRRAEMEATLLPMVRCVLRTGRGHPRLVRWVHRALPAVAGPQWPGQPVDPDQAAGPVARLVCTAMVEQERFRPDGDAAARETVVGL